MIAEYIVNKCEEALLEYFNSNISIRDLSAKYKINRALFSGYALGKGIDIYNRKSKCNDRIFDLINTEEKAYWLGFLYADGNINKYNNSYSLELTLKEDDLEHIQKFKSFMCSENTISYREKQKAYRLSLGSKRIYERLIELGCIPNKSLILKFPNDNQVPKYLLKHFIRGYFDGDGCITIRQNVSSKTACISILGTKDFLTPINNIYGGRLSKRENDKVFTLRFRKEEGLIFLNYIYTDANIYLKRKYDKYVAVLLSN